MLAATLIIVAAALAFKMLPAQAQADDPPAAPTGLSASPVSSDSVTLTWDYPGDSSITGHQALRRFRDGSEYGDGEGTAEFAVIADDTGSAAATYTDASVTPRTRYVYRVKAINPAGTSGQSGHLNVDTPEAPPDRPLSPARGSRPNVVLILADDLGWGDIQSNNPDSAMTTPRIDGIAAAGVNFTDAHSPSSNCSGTRYGLLTGRYAWRTWLTSGVLNGYDRPLIGPDRPTLGTLLQGHGYQTAAVGKWHLGMDFARLSDVNALTQVNRGIDFDAEILDSPVDHGFDEFFGTSANLTWHVPAYIRDNRFTANPDRGNQLESGLIRAKEVLDRLTEEGVGFIERAAPEDDPFFLYLPLNAPHVPMVPNDHFRDSTDLGLYGDFVAQIDWTVGQVLDALERTGASENTLVIFTSDNGSYMGGLPNHMSNDHTENPRAFYYRYDTHQSNGGWFGLKGTINEGGHRVPLLLQWPRKIEAGSTVDATVSLTDLYATLADIMEEEPESGVATDSLSLLPLLLGESETRGTPVVHHSGAGMFALRDGRWKLVFGNGRGSLSGWANGEPFGTPWRLYDLEQDPREVRNAARANPAVMARMEAALDRIRSTENGTLPANAALSKLSLAGIDIGAFNPDEPSYSATVDRGIETVEVTALPTETDAGVSISTPEGRLLYGKPRRGRVEVGLAESSTTITITVEAPDKNATATYTVTVTRAGEAAIAGIPLVGETLTADTSGIAGEDGLSGASFSHQWVSNDGIGDTDIEGATSATYVLTAEDLGKTIGVRVSFTDDAGNEETLTSPATAPVRHSEDVVAWEGELTAGQDAGIIPVMSGYSSVGKLGGTLSPDTFVVDGTTYRVQFLMHAGGGLWLGMTGKLPVDFTMSVGDSRYRGSESKVPFTISQGAYWWASAHPGWPADGPVQVSLTVHPDVPLGDREKAPVAGFFRDIPPEHGGDEDFSFRIHFTELVDTTAEALRDHVMAVTGGKVSSVEAADDHGRAWAVSVTPESADAVTIEIEAGLDCELSGAICTADGRRLFNRMELMVEDREWNPPTGAPIIRGTVEAGQTLTADTSGIADADGLTGATFSYQWVSYDGNADTDIPGATGSTYTLVPADEGKSFRVRVSFTDDAGFEESLTSALFGSEQPHGLNASASDGAVALTWQLPAGWPYSSTFQILRNRPELGETEPLVLVKYLQSPGNTYTDTDVESGVLYVYQVKGVDPFGYTGEASELVEIRAGESTPVENTPATGTPAVSGAVQVGGTLTADTSDITDEDGLDGATFSHQWLADDSDISGATASTYTLVEADEGRIIRVRVSFTDDAGNEETLTSAAPAAVAAAPPSNSPATGAPTISGTAQVGETLTADTTGISDPDGLDNADFDYQWLAGDTAISGAISSTYTLVAADEGRAIRVRVSFTDDGGNDESLTSEATGAVTAGLELRSATVDGLTLTLTYSEILDTGVTLPVTAFIVNVNGSPRSLDSVSVGGSAVTLTLSQAVEEGDPLTVDYAAPDGPGSIWDTRGREAESFSGREVTNNTPTAGPEEPSEPAAPLTAEFLDTPESHDGSAVFTFELRLSEEPKSDFSYTTLRDHAFTVTGGEISGVGRLEPPGNVRWQIKVTPRSDASVTIVLPVTTDCGADGAVCTDDGRPLSSRLEFTIPGPPQNTAAEGGPAIGGTPTVGQTLSAVTTGISDADGLANAVFNYQWLAGDAEIAGATNAAYTVAETDLGEAISVRVSFTDDAGNKETLTSAATEAVAAARPPLTAEFLDTPESHDGSAVFTFELRLREEPKEDFSYQTLLNHAFTVTGGEISGVRRLEPPGNIRWEIQVRPNSGRNVGIVLPITTDCAADGAVCTGDGRMLSSRLDVTVSGPDG